MTNNTIETGEEKYTIQPFLHMYCHHQNQVHLLSRIFLHCEEKLIDR